MFGLNIELRLKKHSVILNFFKILLFILKRIFFFIFYRLFVDFLGQKRLQTFLLWLVRFLWILKFWLLWRHQPIQLHQIN